MNTLPMLMRRELWEHRSLWWVPLVVPVLVVLAAMLGTVNFGLPETANAAARGNLAGIIQWMMGSLQFLIGAFLVFFYLIDCLYTERRDRSILFWKSLPVSDAATVLSKFIVGLVLVPLGVYVIATLTHLIFIVITLIRMKLDLGVIGALTFEPAQWFKVQGVMLVALLIAMLWHVPTVGYLLVLSAWARRGVFLWVVLPPVFAMIVERLFVGTAHIGEFLAFRLSGWMQLLAPRGGFPAVQARATEEGGHRIPSIDGLVGVLEPGAVFASLHLWLGLLVGAALLYAAIRIRALKDDT